MKGERYKFLEYDISVKHINKTYRESFVFIITIFNSEML